MKTFIRKALDYFWLDLKLRYKFFIVYFLCTLIPFMLLAILAGNALSAKTKAVILDSVSATMDQTCDLLSYRLDKVISITQSIYLDTGLYAYLSSPNARTSSYNHNVIEQKLETLSNEKDILNVQLYLVDESKLTQFNFRCMGVSAAEHTGWYAQLTGRDLSSIWWRNAENRVVYYVRKMYSIYDRHALIGYVAVAFSQDRITESLKNLCYTDNSIVCVVDGSSLILSIENARERALADFSAIDLRNENGAAESTIGGVRYWVVSKYIPQHTVSSMPKWDVVLLAPYEELFFSLKTVITAITYTALICIVILDFIAALLIGNITRRIEKVSDNMKLLQAGDFTSNDVTFGRDEISMLRRDFNSMIVRTKLLLKQTVEAHERAKDLELNMLQGQINPHFLYNTLDLINWVAISTKSSEEIPEITNMLARFYKLSLKKGVRIVRIADEIEHIRLYVGLQNKLYENAIALHIDVPESHLDCACIKILLQPIVENSILHGIMERETIQGNIWLTSELDENDLVISVRDDGIGIDPEIMDVLNQRTNWMDENGYGIKNTMDRITLCYGPKYGIRYESEPGKGTTVFVRIPFILYADGMRNTTRLKR